MEIAFVGWGSLIWCPGSLRIKTRWRSDGPRLPLEFARISQDNRLTLVIHLPSADQPTYWALSESTSRSEARENLSQREKANSGDVHYVHRDGTAANGAPREIVSRMTEWLSHHEDIDTVVWTGLESNWSDKRLRDFTPEDAVAFLLELETERDRAKTTYDRAREYVTNAPPLINTEVRRAMRARGWEDAQLATILFEAPSAVQR